MYVLATVSQEAFIAAWIALGDSYDAERDRLADEQQAVMETRPKSLDQGWLQRKRAATVALRKALADRTVLQDKALCELLASSQDIQAQFRERQGEVPLSSWAQDALERAHRVQRVLDERGARQSGSSAAGPCARNATQRIGFQPRPSSRHHPGFGSLPGVLLWGGWP